MTSWWSGAELRDWHDTIAAMIRSTSPYGTTRSDMSSSATAPHDLAIIGSGSAAFAAAIRARDHGRRVVLIERSTIGGTCVNVGCIPSKSLIAAANERWRSRQSVFPGVPTSAGDVDMPDLMAGARKIAGDLRREKYERLAEQYGIDVLHGEASFADAETVVVDGNPAPARAYIVAAGARPFVPSIPGLEESGYLTSTTLLELQRLPSSLVVLGGGYVGLEYAQAFARLGSDVTMVVRSVVARHEEPPIREALTAYLREDGITIHEATEVVRVARAGDTRMLELEQGGSPGGTIEADAVLVATGRSANVERLCLDRAGIATTHGGSIVVDEHMRTTNPRVWAAGDCCDVPQYVYVAAQMGATAADNALGTAAGSIDWSALPRITFTDPSLAAVGLTEAQARVEGIDCRCHTIDLGAASRPWVSRDPRGAIRIVATREAGTIIGASVLAPHAEDLVLAAQLAVRHQLTLADLQQAWTPYLGLGEAFKLAAVSFDRDPSGLSCCA